MLYFRSFEARRRSLTLNSSTKIFALLGWLLLFATAIDPSTLSTSGAQSIGPDAAPGGFVESAVSTEVRPRVVPSLPDRGQFTFLAPYGTTGSRLTNETDCGGADCLWSVGYSYWRNINNHVGGATLLVFLTFDAARGGAGPTLFTYDKGTDQVIAMAPLFGPDDPLRWATGEGWYFSATQPTTLYITDGPRMYRRDVQAGTMALVFDATAQFGAGTRIWQAHSSNDDLVHSA